MRDNSSTKNKLLHVWHEHYWGPGSYSFWKHDWRLMITSYQPDGRSVRSWESTKVPRFHTATGRSRLNQKISSSTGGQSGVVARGQRGVAGRIHWPSGPRTTKDWFHSQTEAQMSLGSPQNTCVFPGALPLQGCTKQVHWERRQERLLCVAIKASGTVKASLPFYLI